MQNRSLFLSVILLVASQVLYGDQPKFIGTVKLISSEIARRIVGKSWKPNPYIQLEDLRYLEIPFIGFDNEPHLGEMIVHKDIVPEVLQIFKELFEHGFQIEKMKLIDEYFKEGLSDNDIDNKSVFDNNTSCFFYRTIGNSKYISEHSMGTAIDLNPRVNPCLSAYICPPDAQEYLDRSRKDVKGFITPETICYKIFTKYGWKWGGEWRNIKDYHHFCKHGRCPDWFNDENREPEWIKAGISLPELFNR